MDKSNDRETLDLTAKQLDTMENRRAACNRVGSLQNAIQSNVALSDSSPEHGPQSASLAYTSGGEAPHGATAGESLRQPEGNMDGDEASTR